MNEEEQIAFLEIEEEERQQAIQQQLIDDGSSSESDVNGKDIKGKKSPKSKKRKRIASKKDDDERYRSDDDADDKDFMDEDHKIDSQNNTKKRRKSKSNSNQNTPTKTQHKRSNSKSNAVVVVTPSPSPSKGAMDAFLKPKPNSNTTITTNNNENVTKDNNLIADENSNSSTQQKKSTTPPAKRSRKMIASKTGPSTMPTKNSLLNFFKPKNEPNAANSVIHVISDEDENNNDANKKTNKHEQENKKEHEEEGEKNGDNDDGDDDEDDDVNVDDVDDDKNDEDFGNGKKTKKRKTSDSSKDGEQTSKKQEKVKKPVASIFLTKEDKKRIEKEKHIEQEKSLRLVAHKLNEGKALHPMFLPKAQEPVEISDSEPKQDDIPHMGAADWILTDFPHSSQSCMFFTENTNTTTIPTNDSKDILSSMLNNNLQQQQSKQNNNTSKWKQQEFITSKKSFQKLLESVKPHISPSIVEIPSSPLTIDVDSNNTSRKLYFSVLSDSQRAKILQEMSETYEIPLKDLQTRFDLLKQRARAVELNAAQTTNNIATSLLWCDKYSPTSSLDVLSNTNRVQALLNWLAKWLPNESLAQKNKLQNKNNESKSKKKQSKQDIIDDEALEPISDVDEMEIEIPIIRKRLRRREDSQTQSKSNSNFFGPSSPSTSTSASSFGDAAEMLTHNAILIRGPFACGKTSVVYALAQQLNVRVIEINPSSDRSGKQLQDLFAEATQSHQVHSSNVANSSTGMDSNRSIIFFDEVDNVFEQDVGFYNALRSFVAITKQPIVLACNEMNSNLNRLRADECFMELELDQISQKQVLVHLELICLVENLQPNRNVLKQLSVFFEDDLRKLMNTVQLWGSFCPKTDENWTEMWFQLFELVLGVGDFATKYDGLWGGLWKREKSRSTQSQKSESENEDEDEDLILNGPSLRDKIELLKSLFHNFDIDVVWNNLLVILSGSEDEESSSNNNSLQQSSSNNNSQQSKQQRSSISKELADVYDSISFRDCALYSDEYNQYLEQGLSADFGDVNSNRNDIVWCYQLLCWLKACGAEEPIGTLNLKPISQFSTTTTTTNFSTQNVRHLLMRMVGPFMLCAPANVIADYGSFSSQMSKSEDKRLRESVKRRTAPHRFASSFGYEDLHDLSAIFP